MLWSRFFIPTAKEVSSEAVVPSHQLALRAGLIRQVAVGSYAHLPLGWRVIRKIMGILREEMEEAGAIELHMPALQPRTWWEESGRETSIGDLLVRPAGKDWQAAVVFGPTHEEVVTDIGRSYVTSYRQLPLVLYQIQTKFRGEERPRGGILRTREFLMKDAYSFDKDKASLDVTYQRMYAAYSRTLTRCGLPFVVVEADPGVMGGNASHEFAVLIDAGDDLVVMSEDGSYAANVDWAARQVPPLPPDPPPLSMRALEEVHTPNCPGIDDVCGLLDIQPRHMIKTLVYQLLPSRGAESGAREGGQKAHPSGGGVAESRFLVVCVRGDHEVVEGKLKQVCRNNGLDGRLALCPLDFAAAAGFVIGYVGPHVVNAGDYRLVIDPDARATFNAVTGANRKEYHVKGFNWTREIRPDRLASAIVADIRRVDAGDRAPSPPALAGSRLRFARAIEVGHIFKLGTTYSRAMKATYLDAGGRPQELVMGSYGIGLDRIMAAAIETHHDEDGIRWPMGIAPFEVIIVAIDARDDTVVEAARGLHDSLASRGVDVLLDDRDERAGFKFKDADLIGIPLRITVGKKALGEGYVELKCRASREIERFSLKDAVEEAVGRVEAARP